MCGIAGFVDKSGRYSADTMAGIATRMADRIAHRGPDDAGTWVSPDGRVALSHRRLSIIDTSSAGHQPMLSGDGRRVITYNGELYNFLELRSELESAGLLFRSRSDTEVLLALIGREGVNALQRLDAMFAFAHYDIEAGELLLARDMFGEKPLYYFDNQDVFAFASELSALAEAPSFDCHVDGEAIASYLLFQYVPAPQSIYRAVKKLLPGCWMLVRRDGEIEFSRYFEFKTAAESRSSRSIADLADELEHILIRSVERRLISDVPIGAFLSGGVNSSTIAAIATQKLGVRLNTFSIGFLGHKDLEHREAAEIAQRLGTEHHERIMAPDAISIGRHIGTVLDEPNADSSCLPTFLLSGFTRETATVALSGDGGDELFGGYSRYFETVDECERKRRRSIAFSAWRPGDAYLSNRILLYPDDVLRQFIGHIPTGLQESVARMRTSINSDRRPLINCLREVDAANYMPGAVLAKVDRMSMQHALEVRAPLLGKEVAEFASNLAGDACYANRSGKIVLKEVAKRFLPEAWINRPKRGFGLPMDLWSAKVLLPITRELITARDARLSAWINPVRLNSYLDSLERDFNAYRVWALFILETWLRTHRAEPVEDAPPFETASRFSVDAAVGIKYALRSWGRRWYAGTAR